MSDHKRGMRPILVRSELTGEVYVVTRYTINDKGYLTAHKKYDVTEDFRRIIGKLPLRESLLVTPAKE